MAHTAYLQSCRLVCDIFGRQVDSELDVYLDPPPVDKVVVLIWLYRDDDELVQFLCGWIEAVSKGRRDAADAGRPVHIIF
jgi:hypothetical protein